MTAGLNVLMTVSANGLLARGGDDNMIWPGDNTDKTIFRMLTLLSNQPLLIGARSFDTLPPLPGREVVRLSRDGRDGSFTLDQAVVRYPGAWLIGGPTVVKAALEAHLIDTFVLCRLGVELEPFTPIEGYWEHHFLGKLKGIHPIPVTFRRDHVQEANVRVMIFKNLYRGEV